MPDSLPCLSDVRRPCLLVRAARHGVDDYVRRRDLERLVPLEAGSDPVSILRALMRKEAELEANRKSGDLSYSITRHIEVMSAMMAEARTVTIPAT